MLRKLTPWILALLFLAPLTFIGIIAFSAGWEFPEVFPKWGFSAWEILLGTSSSSGLFTLFSSALLAFVVAVLSSFLGYFLSYLLMGKRRTLLLWLSLIPFCTAPVILAANFQFFFISAHLSASWLGVLIAQLLIGVPYAFLLFSTFWNKERKTIDDAARTLGASDGVLLWKVHLPAAKGLLRITLIQLFLFSWFEYGMTQYIGVGQVKTLTVEVFRYMQEGNMAVAAVASLLLILPPFIALLLIRKVNIGNA
ncbi:MAG: putative spermidine/putrescine transport system permease protein [Flavobacteriales bacterium]|jgi:putative spermidine/putrescine transport system permease protein